MQERQHVKTTPGELKAPEVIPHPVRREDGHDVQTDDINIPMVGIFVIFFGILLSVVIISLQAWFYGYQENERSAKLASQESRQTELGKLLHNQRLELHNAARAEPRTSPSAATAPATGAAVPPPPPVNRIPIDAAMQRVAADYAGGNQGNR